MPRMMVELDDSLLDQAKRLSGARTKRAAIELALRELIRHRKAAELARMAGRIDIRLTRHDIQIMREAR